MNRFIKYILLCSIVPNVLFANQVKFLINTQIGYSQNQNAYKQDGQTNIARLALGTVSTKFEHLNFGAEFGIQNGNSYRLAIDKPIIDSMGGVPIEVQLKPIIDGLFTIQYQPLNTFQAYGLLKAGMAYRHLQTDRESVNDLSELSPELQAGIGYKVKENLQLQLVYQQIGSSDMNFQFNSQSDLGQINHIPSQKGVLLGISLLF